MLKHLYLIFIATFILGFLSGIVIYLNGNTGKEGDGSIEEASRGFVVIANRYGGKIGLISSSYRMTENGVYTYIERSEEGAEAKFNGTLPKAQLNAIKSGIKNVPFKEIQSSSFVGVCPIETGGYAYRYTVLYEEDEYAYDSCKQDLDNSFFKTLNTLFDQLHTTRSVGV